MAIVLKSFRRLAMVLLVSTAACGNEHPEHPTSGIYAMTSAIRNDTCDASPTPVTDIQVGVFSNPQNRTLSTFTPWVSASGTAFERVDLLDDEFNSSRTSSFCGTGTLTVKMQVEDKTTHSFSISRALAWSSVTPATTDCIGEVPAHDCSIDDTLAYKLKARCEDPCEIKDDDVEAGTLKCVCN